MIIIHITLQTQSNEQLATHEFMICYAAARARPSVMFGSVHQKSSLYSHMEIESYVFAYEINHR